ncbi:Protein of unknown function (DUF2634) [Schinkia azotoformans MEV2011]|uniref:DUF2634 domain-containing protein n=1 Tax=Schinkia azotoformans MEV2011 TaxID=1348973 RepID=A0A072NSD6_SCHAZ|nr:DUF2634 domain-containing protein [Schinkia azotoformans]KEF40401.1 Protein of unknown function (DUF2634) [Schinkia azotoformans MEV2011]MEC1696188.1 DUF2634 domain-containing protein [Schinkia azotoformans]MEC1725309.1 DUF2634 domain-containing protein [Schinkia azotoformans]MEC1779420.1 DUF2634 domain-containing protein [Schinkia azotoformans]MED4330095.1 DUF2634 domain-containing protein [Schinkia azotoformans]
MVLPTEAITLFKDLTVVNAAELPTKTYKLDFEKGTCSGFIDRKEAMEQAIYKALQTLWNEHLIYSSNYGFENMMGHEEIFVRAELPRRIKEALLQDERITAIENFTLDFIKDEVFVTFTAVTIYGDVDVLREAIPFV